jgi:cytochrome P450
VSAAFAAEASAAVFPPGPRDWTPFPFTRGMRDEPLGFVGGLISRHGAPSAPRAAGVADDRTGAARSSRVRGFVHGMIDAHRRQDPLPDDLLGLLLRVRDEETGAPLSDRELFDEPMTFVNAGHETTAVTLAWALYEIGRDPVLRERLEAEVDAVAGRRTPGFADLARLELLGRSIRETLRLHPPGWLLPRQALEDDAIDGVLIPKRAVALVSVYFLHRHPAHWSDPERFDPDRFLPGRGEPRHAMAYLPFGLGGRRCVGEDFALLELRAVLARVLRRFHVEVDPSHPVLPKPELTLKPAHGVRLRIEPRRAA